MNWEEESKTPLSIIFNIVLIFDYLNILHIQQTKLIQRIKKDKLTNGNEWKELNLIIFQNDNRIIQKRTYAM